MRSTRPGPCAPPCTASSRSRRSAGSACRATSIGRSRGWCRSSTPRSSTGVPSAGPREAGTFAGLHPRAGGYRGWGSEAVMDTVERAVRIGVSDRVAGSGEIEGDLRLPHDARGLVLFAHGSGSSRHSPRNRMVAEALNVEGLATLLFDLLTSAEEAVDLRTRHLRFDIPLLAERLLVAGGAIADRPDTAGLPVGT